jgi:hypothetical protein
MLPGGRGPFTGVVGQFGSTMQLYIRDIDEVQLFGLRCDGSSGTCDALTEVLQDFSSVVQYDPISLPCWRNIATAGTVRWEGGTFSGTSFARCEAYSSGEATNVMWLVSPDVVFTPGMTLSFLTEKAYWDGADPFALLISTNFDGANIGGATWTTIPCTHATDSDVDYTWVSSGAIDLAAHLPVGYSGNFVVAFRYTGGDPSNTTRYDIDDVLIQ